MLGVYNKFKLVDISPSVFFFKFVCVCVCMYVSMCLKSVKPFTLFSKFMTLNETLLSLDTLLSLCLDVALLKLGLIVTAGQVGIIA